MSTAPTTVFGRAPIVDKNGNLTRDALKLFLQMATQLNNLADQVGNLVAPASKIGSNAIVAGRAGTLQTGMSNLDPAGIFSSLGKVADTSTDHLTDGTGTPLLGGKRGAQALDANNRLASTSNLTAVNAAATPTTQPLSAATGAGANQATINIASFQVVYPFGTVTYNSGSITPLNDSTKYYVYCDDPTYAGGALAYHATTSNPNVTSTEGRLYLGSIPTPAFGGGGTSGGGGGNGGCFSGSTRCILERGMVRFDECGAVEMVLTKHGFRSARLLIHEYNGEMRDMGVGEYVTPGHRIWRDGAWQRAENFFSRRVNLQGLVYNWSIDTKDEEERNYRLANGELVHNALKA